MILSRVTYKCEVFENKLHIPSDTKGLMATGTAWILSKHMLSTKHISIFRNQDQEQSMFQNKNFWKRLSP